MIKVGIHNVQSIKKLDFEVNGFTVLFGRNNIGKTATVRAIVGALSNDPPKDLLRRDTNSLKVELGFKQPGFDDVDIIWEKSENSSINRYTINGQEFNKIARIKAVELASQLKIDVSELRPQIREQDDRLFLKDVSSNVMFEQFLTGFSQSIVRQALNLVNTDVKDLQSKLKVYTGELDKVTSKLSILRQLFEKSDNLEKFAQKQGMIAKETYELNRIKEVMTELGLVNSRIKHFTELSSRWNNLIEVIKKDKKDLDYLIWYKDTKDKVLRQLENWDILVVKLQKFLDRIGLIKKNQVNIERDLLISQRARELGGVVKEILVIEDSFAEQSAKLNDVIKKKNEFKYCPYCGQLIN